MTAPLDPETLARLYGQVNDDLRVNEAGDSIVPSRTLRALLDAAGEQLTDEQIDDRIRRYHDVACDYRRNRDALPAPSRGLEERTLRLRVGECLFKLGLEEALSKVWDTIDAALAAKRAG